VAVVWGDSYNQRRVADEDMFPRACSPRASSSQCASAISCRRSPACLGSGMMVALLYWPVSHVFGVTVPVRIALLLCVAAARILIYAVTVSLLWKAAGWPTGGEALISDGLMRFASA
jgi:hypothetical protein